MRATRPSADIAGSRFALESGEPRAQVALIPTGRLSLLPLHATILDEFTVMYAASAMALAVEIYAAAGEPAERLLGLALQWPASLPHARAESESIADLLPDGHSRTLYEHQAGRGPLLDALPDANLVHVSCHGQFQADDPLASGLLLADGQLTLREIMAPGFTALDSTRLAVLSACHPAKSRWPPAFAVDEVPTHVLARIGTRLLG